MQRPQLIEPRSVKFAQRLRDRYLLSPAGADLAQMVLEKYAGFNRAGIPALPVPMDHGLTWRRSEVYGSDQNGTERSSERGPARSALGNIAAPAVATSAEKMVQRRAVSSSSSVVGVSTREPGATAEAAAPPAASSSAGRFPASQPRSHELPWSHEREIRLVPARFLAASPATRPVSFPSSALGRAQSAVRPVVPAGSERRWLPRIFLQRPAAVTEISAAAAVIPSIGGIPLVKRSPVKLGFLAPVAASSASARSALDSVVPGQRSEDLERFPDYGSPVRNLNQALAHEHFHTELFWRDIRVNPLGRADNLFSERESMNPAPSAPWQSSLELDLPRAPVAREPAASALASTPQEFLAGAEGATASAPNREMRSTAEPQMPSVPEVADKVYRLLERRLMIERERRGVFRS